MQYETKPREKSIQQLALEKLVKEFDCITCMIGGQELIDLAKAALREIEGQHDNRR